MPTTEDFEGEITIITCRDGNRIFVSVSDNGCGFDYETAKRVFDRDYSSRNSTGIGLSVTRAIIEKLGGAIGVGAVPGQGSSFSFWLPVASNDDTVAAA